MKNPPLKKHPLVRFGWKEASVDVAIEEIIRIEEDSRMVVLEMEVMDGAIHVHEMLPFILQSNDQFDEILDILNKNNAYT
jgi:hypothetical protein